ncbi:hypothetical protein HMPREF9554_02237 [Treponema phagedenis F0421]|nr:hypothetical protein HMPREF9554_02237 [Treponema phagedenis F0421]
MYDFYSSCVRHDNCSGAACEPSLKVIYCMINANGALAILL